MTGLVLEGGAMRGLYTAGILDVMMENDIRVDAAIGVSAGALFGCNYKSGQIGRAVRYNTQYCRDPRHGTLRSLLKTGDLYDVDFCYRELPRELDVFDTEAFRANPLPFYVVCTDAVTGQPVYHRCDTGDDNDLTWMRASGSLPVVSRAVEVDGYQLLDGGIADSIPVDYFRSLGYRRNIVVLTREAGYRKRGGKGEALMNAALRRYPAVAKAMAARAEMYNRQLDTVARLEAAGECLVFRPSLPVTLSHTEHDPDKLRALYELGRSDAEARLPRLREFVQAD